MGRMNRVSVLESVVDSLSGMLPTWTTLLLQSLPRSFQCDVGSSSDPD